MKTKIAHNCIIVKLSELKKAPSHSYDAFTNRKVDGSGSHSSGRAQSGTGTGQPDPLTGIVKEIFWFALLLAGIALIATGIVCWFDGAQPASKFLVATGVWIELHLFSALQEEQIN